MSRYEIHLLEGAEDDARDAYLYYFRVSRSVALQFRERLESAVADLKESAHQYQIVRDRIRRYPLEQFPHGLVYEIDGEVVVASGARHRCRRLSG